MGLLQGTQLLVCCPQLQKGVCVVWLKRKSAL